MPVPATNSRGQMGRLLRELVASAKAHFSQRNITQGRI